MLLQVWPATANTDGTHVVQVKGGFEGPVVPLHVHLRKYEIGGTLPDLRAWQLEDCEKMDADKRTDMATRLERATWQLVSKLYPDVTCTVPVVLHVYDWGGGRKDKKWLMWLNRTLGFFFGVYHTGVEVMGREYSFGWNNRGTTGVFNTWPLEVVRYFQHQHRVVLPLGHVNVSVTELRRRVQVVKDDWPGGEYDMLHRNCNHCCAVLAASIGAQAPTPLWINSLADCVGAPLFDSSLWAQRKIESCGPCRRINGRMVTPVDLIEAVVVEEILVDSRGVPISATKKSGVQRVLGLLAGCFGKLGSCCRKRRSASVSVEQKKVGGLAMTRAGAAPGP